MDEQEVTMKAIGIVSVEPAVLKNGQPAISLCIDDGSDRFQEYVLTNLREVRSLIALLTASLAHHGDPWAEEVYEKYINPGESPDGSTGSP